MANLNALILTAADYKVLLIIPNGGSFPLLTAETISYNNAREEETIYAIGEEKPIGNKRNAVKFSGKLSLQNGEMSAILQSVGFVESTQIANATLAITAIQGGFARTHTGLNINTEAVDIKAKDKQSIVSLDWTATDVK
jgi:hypothetical protein